jgi:SecD/SecF fusion protein
VLDDIEPPQSLDVLRDRLRAMRLQPGFEKYGWRESTVFPLNTKTPGSNLYSRVMVVVADENYPMEDEKGGLSSAWVSELAVPEVKLLTEALNRQTSLSQITQFDKQVSADAQLNAYMALGLSWLMIVIYVWFRFGKARWGIAAVIALIHDLIITTGCVVATHYIADTAIGRALMIDKFRIDLGMLAALLTIVGYSVNDTIIVFDRIRENRGRGTEVTPDMISHSINQTLSRTVLTVLTVQMTVIIMYIIGGQGIHSFNYVMLIGLSFGTYSSVAIASQFLLKHKQLASARTSS